MNRRWLIFLFGVALAIPSPAKADRLNIWTWSSSQLINYKIYSTFYSLMTGAPAAIMDASYAWFADTALAARLNYAGSTTDSTWVSDNRQCPTGLENKVVPITSCSPDGCNVLAETFEACCDTNRQNCNRFKIETYIHSGVSWATGMVAWYQLDLLGNTLHEFGHALDLAHTDCSTPSVMCQGDLELGDTKWRYLYTKDQSDIESMYADREEHLYYSESYDDVTWAASSAIDNTKYATTGPTTAFGWDPLFYPFHGIAWADSQESHSLPYPINTLNKLDLSRTRVFSRGSHAAPGMAYDVANPRHYVAWSTRENNSRSIYWASSVDGFATLDCGQTMGPLTYNDGRNSFAIASYDNPVLAYEPYSQRIFLVWVNYDPDCPQAAALAGSSVCQQFVDSNNNTYRLYDRQILMASVPSGSTCFASVTNLVNYQYNDTSVAGPAFACNDSTTTRNCILAFPSTDGFNTLKFVPFRFNSNGTLLSRGTSVSTPYSDASQSSVGLTFDDGTFAAVWRQVGTSSSTISRPLGAYSLELSSGNVQFLQRVSLSLSSTHGPALTADGNGMKMMVWTN